MKIKDFQLKQNPKIIEANSKLRDVAVSLGKYNLDYLLQFCSFISILSFLNWIHKKESINLWRYFDPVFIKKLCKAILLSNSNSTKRGYFQINDFIDIYNRLKEIDTLVYSEDAPDTFNQMLASVANTQSYYQEADFSREIGRSILLFDTIPTKYELKRDRWVDVFAMFKNEYGILITEIYPLILALVMHCESRYKTIYDELEKTPERILPQAVLEKFHTLLEQGDLCTINIYNEDIPVVTFNAFSRFCESISVPLRDVRSLIRGITSSIMVSDWHPFRIQPLVNVAPNMFIIPSLWELIQYIRKLPSIFIANQESEIAKQIYTNMGLCYEKYVFDYMITKHSSTLIISESNFTKSELGPDISIIDPVSQTGIFIEVKSASIPLPSRNDPMLWENKLNELLELVEKLDKKVKRIYKGEGDYKQYRTDIEKCDTENSILVVVCGDLGFFFDAMLIDRVKKSVIINRSDRVLFLDIHGIEDLIEYSYQTKTSLVEAFSILIDIQNKSPHERNVKNAFSQYDRKLTPWYLKFTEENITQVK